MIVDTNSRYIRLRVLIEKTAKSIMFIIHSSSSGGCRDKTIIGVLAITYLKLSKRMVECDL